MLHKDQLKEDGIFTEVRFYGCVSKITRLQIATIVSRAMMAGKSDLPSWLVTQQTVYSAYPTALILTMRMAS